MEGTDAGLGDTVAPKRDEAGGGVDRRTFVKGAVVGAALGAAGAGGIAVWGWLRGQDTAADARVVTYAGAQVQVGSPTKRGVPIVPLFVDASGYVLGRAEDLRPFVYCGREGEGRWEGASEGAAVDDYLRFHVDPHKLAIVPEAERSARWWFYPLLGERVRVDHFRDRAYGDGATFSWRDPRPEAGFVGVIIKLRRSEIEAQGAAADVLDSAMDQGNDLVAFDAACTHFCCNAGWHEDPVAERLGFWDTIFCTCHNARFDPRKVETYEFEIRPSALP